MKAPVLSLLLGFYGSILVLATAAPARLLVEESDPSQPSYSNETAVLSQRYLRQITTKNEKQQQQQHNRKIQVGDGQNCPALYPDEDDVVLTLSEDFMKQKVKRMIDFATLVHSGVQGRPIEDLIDEQRPNYERFDGWSDIDDQALVAKTKDTQICFAAFQSVIALNPFGTYDNSYVHIMELVLLVEIMKQQQ